MNKNILNSEFETKKIIRKSGLDKPDNDFASSIMTRINNNPLHVKAQYTPILPGKFWVFLVSVTTGFILLITVILLNSHTASIDKGGNYSQFYLDFKSVIEGIIAMIDIPVYTHVVLITAFLVLLVDYFIVMRKKIDTVSK